MQGLLRVVASLLIVVAAPSAALAQPTPDVPPALAAWRNWVLYGEEFRSCPVRKGTLPGQAANHVCAWPGMLTLDVGGASAKFEQSWTVYADTFAWSTRPASIAVPAETGTRTAATTRCRSVLRC
jgi:hypothetical protein